MHLTIISVVVEGRVEKGRVMRKVVEEKFKDVFIKFTLQQ